MNDEKKERVNYKQNEKKIRHLTYNEQIKLCMYVYKYALSD